MKLRPGFLFGCLTLVVGWFIFVVPMVTRYQSVNVTVGDKVGHGKREWGTVDKIENGIVYFSDSAGSKFSASIEDVKEL